MSPSAGFGWGTVILFHSSQYSIVLWICAGNTVDNTVFIPTELRLHSVRTFFACHPTLPVIRLGVGKDLGGDTADPN